jgi:hypothetical protein
MKQLFKGVLTLAIAVCMMGGGAAVRADDGQHGNNNGNNGNCNNNCNNVQVRLRTTLAGASIAGIKPEGNADFRNDGQGRTRLNVEVENVNLPAGTVLTVTLTHAGVSSTVGTITLGSNGENELELDSQNGATVPAIVSGDMISVSNGAATILAGAF